MVSDESMFDERSMVNRIWTLQNDPFGSFCRSQLIERIPHIPRHVSHPILSRHGGEGEIRTHGTFWVRQISSLLL
jgi:hypothetical protein